MLQSATSSSLFTPGFMAYGFAGQSGTSDGQTETAERRMMRAQGPAPICRVLVVDDEKIIADTLAVILNLSGFAARAAYTGEQALDSIGEHCPDIVLTDVRMPGRSGIETARLIQQSCPEIRVVLFSGQAGTAALMEQARREGFEFELWSKPIHPRELVRRLRAL